LDVVTKFSEGISSKFVKKIRQSIVRWV